MPFLQVKGSVKDFNLGKVFAVRLSRLTKNGRKQRSSTTTYHEGDHSVPADIPVQPSSLATDPGLQVSINISTATSSRVDSSARTASDMAQTFLPVVQAVASAIPFAGPPMQATISGLLSILQAIDRRSQNKADLDRLASRLHRLSSHLWNAPNTQDPFEQYRRDSLIRMLQDISAQVKQLYDRGLAYTSVTQAIVGCSSEIDRYLAEYLWSSQMQGQHDIHEVLEILRRQQDSVGPTATQLTAAVTLGCVTLVDATGHEHAISVTFCTSFQQLNEMLQVLFKRDSIEAQLQRRYMEQGQYDLCIDDDKQVTRLTSQCWPSIEAGTTIVMRVVIEQATDYGADYKCHFCGAINHSAIRHLPQRKADCSINCRVCKRRFQISSKYYSAKPSTQSSNIDPVPRTELEMHLIRNLHIQQMHFFFTPAEYHERRQHSLAVNENARNFDTGGASAHSHRSGFLGDGPTISPQPSYIPPSHDAGYRHNRIEEIEEDSNDDYDEQDGAEDSDDALPTVDGEDHEEWQDCEDGEAHEQTNYYFGEL